MGFCQRHVGIHAFGRFPHAFGKNLKVASLQINHLWRPKEKTRMTLSLPLQIWANFKQHAQFSATSL